MNKQLLYTLFLVLPVLTALAADDNKYAVSKIDAALLKDASVVKRYELIRFEIKDPGSAVYYYKTAITILNENGDDHAGWAESYDKFSSIRSVDASLYDATGKKIKSLKSAEISDRSGTSEGSLAEDNRYKSHNFHYKVYPYTVEYEVEVKVEQLMFIPSWMPVERDDAYAVESSIFEIVCPADYKIRYKAYRYDKEPVITPGKQTVYHWEVKGLPVVKMEFAGPEWQKITPTVIVGPTNFEIDGFKGNMSNWTEFGKFVYTLKQNRDALPATVKAKVHELADKEADIKGKIAALYQYMQQNTRYISIQLGIGGWQPFDATSVAEKKYGDCKALTNFMFALLKEAGIRSVYTLVKAGEQSRYIHEDFAASQFNHVILSVPLQKDTVWLECTDQLVPAGYLGGFTCNRFALMVDEDGGHLVRTPVYNFNDNLQLRKVNATVDETGKLQANIETQYTGMEQDELFGFINSHSKKEQLEYLKKEIDLPTYYITYF
jgi:transglutaminase-like putative cysteine protease